LGLKSLSDKSRSECLLHNCDKKYCCFEYGLVGEYTNVQYRGTTPRVLAVKSDTCLRMFTNNLQINICNLTEMN